MPQATPVSTSPCLQLMSKKIFEFILDLIFPKYCFGCHREGDWLCKKCKIKILPIKTQTCPNCKRITQAGRYCPRCAKKVCLSGVIVAAYFEEGPVKELIHNFKYNHIVELSKILGDLLENALRENQQYLGKNLLVTAVPIHYLRKAQRGYNQAEILAECVSMALKFPKNFKIIKKIRKTRPQVQTEAKKRRKNLINSIQIYKNISLSGTTVILVDDVMTTGTTLNECARILKEAGARRVWGLVVAKG